MRFCGKVLAAALVLAAPAASLAASCTSQAELSPQDRAALTEAGQQLTQAVIGEDLVTLKADLLPAEASAWDTISAAVDRAQPLPTGPGTGVVPDPDRLADAEVVRLVAP